MKKENKIFFSLVTIFTLLVSLLQNVVVLHDLEVEAKGVLQTKTFHSLDRGNFSYDNGKIKSIGYVDKKTELNPNGGVVLGTRYKTDEKGTPVYCLNWELDSPKASGNVYKATSEKITSLEYTALLYGFGGEKDRTTKYKNPINNNKPFNANERYYISQMALYAVTNDKGTKEHLRTKHMINHTRGLVNEKVSKALYDAIIDHVDFIKNNTLAVPKEENISIDILNKTNEMVQMDGFLQTAKPIIIKTDNTKGKLKLDKSGLGKAYFVNENGEKVNDDYVLSGNEFYLRLNDADASEKGKVAFGVSGEVSYTNLTKYVPENSKDTGVDGRELQRITWVSEETVEASNSFKVNYERMSEGELEITKVDAENGKVLSRAKFEVKNSKGEVVVEGETDSRGIARFSKLPEGKYTYKEVEAPTGYVLEKTEFPFEIKKNGEVIKAKMTNEMIKGDLEISKTDVADGKPLPNTKFKVKNENGEVVAEGTTDENGVAYFKDLPYGKYTYQEYEAPEGYVIDETEFPFEIKESGEVIKAKMTNEMIKGDLEISKTDVADGKPLPNTKFKVKNENGEVVAEGTTDENGVAYFKDLPYGKYTYQEYEAPEGYVIDETEFPFEIKENGEVIKAKMTNEKEPESVVTPKEPVKQEPTKTQRKGQVKSEPVVTKEIEQPKKGNLLPNTATDMFNLLAVGLGLLLLGGVALLIIKRKKKAE